ncbi:MAG TPA: hypothetical protein DGZ24_00705 [Rhodospirillaceae bacterium]|nr:hypothetical protein [Rhodospirillaceae bacterium]|tara:strand:+ start:4089 stop:4274 length:186 start_codon:yes stop_codon:yes gene_type:complete
MTKERSTDCYGNILGQIDTLELKVRRIKEQLTILKEIVSGHPDFRKHDTDTTDDFTKGEEQ